MHPEGPNPAGGSGGEASSALGIVSLLLSLAGCLFFPIAAVVSGLFLHGADSALTAITVLLGAGAVSVLAAIVLAIVALARGRGGKVPAIIALVFAVLSIPAGIAGGFFALLFTSGGAHGRPFRAGGKERRSRTAHGDAWSIGGPEPSTAGLDERTRERLADGWLADATLEHASVAAFSSLSLDLVALGAPPDLVRRAHEAAIDEVGHAQACFAIASAYAGRDLTAAPFPEVGAPRPREVGAGLLRRVAVESAVDGCIGEGAAASIAALAAARAGDRAIADVLERIARDEARHATLARDVLAFCLERGGDTLLDEIRVAIERDATTHGSITRDDEKPSLADHGRASDAEWAMARATARRELSLVSQGHDRIERRGAPRGEEAERDAGRRARSHRDRERERIELHRPAQGAAQEGDRA